MSDKGEKGHKNKKLFFILLWKLSTVFIAACYGYKLGDKAFARFICGTTFRSVELSF